MGAWGRDLACAYAAGADGPFVGAQGLARELRAVLRISDEEASGAAWHLMEAGDAILPPPPEGCCHGGRVDFGVLQSWTCQAHPGSSVEAEAHPDDVRAAAGEEVYVCWGYRSPDSLTEDEFS